MHHHRAIQTPGHSVILPRLPVVRRVASISRAPSPRRGLSQDLSHSDLRACIEGLWGSSSQPQFQLSANIDAARPEERSPSPAPRNPSAEEVVLKAVEVQYDAPHAIPIDRGEYDQRLNLSPSVHFPLTPHVSQAPHVMLERGVTSSSCQTDGAKLSMTSTGTDVRPSLQERGCGGEIELRSPAISFPPLTQSAGSSTKPPRDVATGSSQTDSVDVVVARPSTASTATTVRPSLRDSSCGGDGKLSEGFIVTSASQTEHIGAIALSAHLSIHKPPAQLLGLGSRDQHQQTQTQFAEASTQAKAEQTLVARGSQTDVATKPAVRATESQADHLLDASVEEEETMRQGIREAESNGRLALITTCLQFAIAEAVTCRISGSVHQAHCAARRLLIDAEVDCRWTLYVDALAAVGKIVNEADQVWRRLHRLAELEDEERTTRLRSALLEAEIRETLFRLVSPAEALERTLTQQCFTVREQTHLAARAAMLSILLHWCRSTPHAKVYYVNERSGSMADHWASLKDALFEEERMLRANMYSLRDEGYHRILSLEVLDLESLVRWKEDDSLADLALRGRSSVSLSGITQGSYVCSGRERWATRERIDPQSLMVEMKHLEDVAAADFEAFSRETDDLLKTLR